MKKENKYIKLKYVLCVTHIDDELVIYGRKLCSQT